MQRFPSLETGIYALGRLEFAELFPNEEETRPVSGSSKPKFFQRQIATSVGLPCRRRQGRNTPLAWYLMVSPHLPMRTLLETRDSDIDRMAPSMTRRDLETVLIEKCWKDLEFKKQVISDPKGTLERHTGQKLPRLPAQIKIFIREEDANTLSFSTSSGSVEFDRAF